MAYHHKSYVVRPGIELATPGLKTDYRKNPKISDTRKICGNHPKIQTRWLQCRVMRTKDVEGIANSVDSDRDQIAPLGAVCSGSALFAQTQTYLPKNLESLQNNLSKTKKFVDIYSYFLLHLNVKLFLRICSSCQARSF